VGVAFLRGGHALLDHVHLGLVAGGHALGLGSGDGEQQRGGNQQDTAAGGRSGRGEKNRHQRRHERKCRQGSRRPRPAATGPAPRYSRPLESFPRHRKSTYMDPILIGKGTTDDVAVTLLPRFGNRHGLVAGATGTGKTVTLMTLA